MMEKSALEDERACHGELVLEITEIADSNGIELVS